MCITHISKGMTLTRPQATTNVPRERMLTTIVDLLANILETSHRQNAEVRTHLTQLLAENERLNEEIAGRRVIHAVHRTQIEVLRDKRERESKEKNRKMEMQESELRALRAKVRTREGQLVRSQSEARQGRVAKEKLEAMKKVMGDM